MSFRLAFSKVHQGAKSPERAHPSDAGMDVVYCPLNSKSHGILCPMKNALFETGLKFEVPHGYMLLGCNKSGVASKRNLVLGACVIDSGYSGEVFVDIHNIGERTQVIKPGDKIAQLVLVPIVHAVPVEVTEDSLYLKGTTFSERGDGALGSTGDE